MSDRARGALLGMAVGDALGTTYEFERMTQPELPALATGPATDVVGGGPFGLVAGQITDDTQLAVCLARSLHAHGTLDVADLAERFVAWRTHAFDIGSQTRASIDRLEAGEPASSAGLAVWRSTERRAAGNGSLMRTAPIGVAYAPGDALINAAIAESLITHADPRCALACAAFDSAIAAAIAGPLDGRAMVEVARASLTVAHAKLRAAWHGDALDLAAADQAAIDLASDLDAALATDPELYSSTLHILRTAGFVRVAFRLAFWHAVHTPAWRDALVDTASRGGDADTNAAIVGALLGARDGAGAIPSAWVDRVLAATQPGPQEWADAHHPRHLLALVRE
ncbi:MAG: ADP-ribosylglycohydrolase family protein [Kofleriaceae bacterium]